MSDAPLDLYIAAYDDPAAAKQDYDELKKLQHGGYIFIDGAVLVSREADGKLTVKETGDHDVFKGSAWGIAGGFVVGLFAPPLLAATVVGAVAGGVIGKIAKSHQERGIAKDVEETLKPGTSGVVAVFEEIWVDEVETALARATKKAVKQVDKQEAKELKVALKQAKKEDKKMAAA
jgi:uncharacterized membrane protein